MKITSTADIQEIKSIVKVHKELHGINGMVEYAIMNDIMRRDIFKDAPREAIQEIMEEIISELT